MAEEKRRLKVLVAEDTESNYQLVYYILRSEYDIVWARDGIETIDLYDKEQPDIILMDIRMPKLSGLATATQIRSRDPRIPIIAVTAFAFESDKAKAIDAGCTDFLAKPISASALKEMIHKHLKDQ